MRFLFVMDPASTMHPAKDTSFAFMRAAQVRGHQLLHCLPAQVGLREGRVWAQVSSLRVSETAPFVEQSASQELAVDELEAVFIRKDPPFDANYLFLTQVLEHLPSSVLVLNRPDSIRDQNEKLFALRFSEWMPKTEVTSSAERIMAFVAEHEQAVLKPLDGAGGSGVVMLGQADRNTRALIDLITQEGRRLAMVQAFLPTISQGDKRVLLLDGKLLGVIRRVPQKNEFRANIHVGGQVEATQLSEREQALVASVGPVLSELGLYFVGLDLIDGQLIEINVTSPTGIQELSRLSGRAGSADTPELEVIDWVVAKVKSLQKKGS